MKKRIISLILALAMIMSSLLVLGSCSSCNEEDNPTGGGNKPDALVLMTETLDGLFNPFYSTTAADGSVVGMTQIGMISTGVDENGDVTVAYGNNEACVVLDYSESYNQATDKTEYTFVLKNGIKFSDGKPLTMNDVLFNLYVYLDPVYTGSSTMYSTDIVGLMNYRTQSNASGDDADDLLTQNATTYAKNRRNELINIFKAVTKGTGGVTQPATYEAMVAKINSWSISSGYKTAIGETDDAKARAQLLADYELALSEFKKELNTDYESAKDAYTEEPYKSAPTTVGVTFNDVVSFMYAEGYYNVKYAKDENYDDIKTQFEELTPKYSTDVVVDKESAINYVYTDKIESQFDIVIQYWATANTLLTQFTAKATEVILNANKKDDGSLIYPNISGIQSLGHSKTATTVTIGDNVYNVAQNYNADGTVADENAYAVLRITINGVDPKAIWNFGFGVAPQHYYAPGYTVDIANNKFGVEYASFDFMTNVIQSPRNIQVPMGAGPYVATDASNNDNPGGTAFFANNVVYFKANPNFLLGAPKIEKLRYQVLSTSNAINALEAGTVHYITPQFTQDNIDRLNTLASSGIDKVYSDQLGYGYIGINAGKIPDLEIRKAIMLAMNTYLALSYYSTGMAQQIYYPMSMVSWAYPKTNEGDFDRDNGHAYPPVGNTFDEEEVKEQILLLMQQAGASKGDSRLEITFTVAGASLTDHPTYLTFQKAADILNECGWDVEVVSDTQALTKLSTGSLEVWAAAWGSSIDPDMYQVYHKNSTATSVLAWGYREILASPGTYARENAIINELSALIDDAREITDETERAKIYKEAMELVLDLCVELPVYQRKVLYAYNTNIIDPETLPEEINPYTSPLDRIWEIEFAD